MKSTTITAIICSLLVFLFVYTALSKLHDYRGYTTDMYNQPLPHWLTVVLTPVLPVAELGIAACLMTDRWRATGCYLSFLLMLAFTFYTLLVLFHTFRYVPCSCGGMIKSLSWGEHLALDLFFLLLSAAGIFLLKKQPPADAIPFSREQDFAENL